MLSREEKPSQGLEAALRRALKGADEPARADCPGADVLAAYYDRTMTRVDRPGVEAHLAQCARCASTLAMMARADSAARSSERAERPGAWFWVTRVVAPASLAGLTIALAITFRSAQKPQPEVVAMASRRPAWPARREAPSPPLKAEAPALAGAAGGQAASSEAKLATAPAPAHEEARQAEAPAAGVPSASASVAPPEEIARNEAAAPNLASPVEAQHKEKLGEPETPKQQPPQALAEAASAQASKPEATAPTQPLGAQAAAPAVASTAPAAPLADLGARAKSAPAAPTTPQIQTGAALHRPESRLGAASSVAPAPPAGTASSGAAVGGAAVQEGALKSLQAGTVAAPTGVFETSVTGGNQIYSPDHRSAWQIGPGGAVMRWTTDTGWHPQRSGVTVDLLAGAAPSDAICWLVGKSGTVIRTVDGGKHWELAAAPTTQNLSQVAAKDADNASVVATDGARFTTHDGGATWSSP